MHTNPPSLIDHGRVHGHHANRHDRHGRHVCPALGPFQAQLQATDTPTG